MEARQTTIESGPGEFVEVWGYCLKGKKPTVPGPTIKVSEDTKIRVYFTNRLTVPASLHPHGVKGNTSDFDPFCTVNPTDIVEPGNTRIFQWDTSGTPGTWFYHTAAFDKSGEDGIYKGLWGALIVEPKEEQGFAPDKEFVVFMQEGEKLETFNGTPDSTENSRGERSHTNGLVWKAMMGEKVRFHLINISDEVYTFHARGHSWVDGNRGESIDEVNIAPFSSYVADFIAGKNAGPENWEFYFSEHMMDGQFGTFVVEERNTQSGFTSAGKTGRPRVTSPESAPPTLDNYSGSFLYTDPKLKSLFEDFVGLSKGDGPWADYYTPIPIYQYFNPARHYIPPDSAAYEKLLKTYQPDQCVECHEETSPAIVNEWKMSDHASPKKNPHLAAETREIEELIGKELNNWTPGTTDGVYCSYCHGEDHEKLFMPTVDNSCGACHPKQAEEFMKGRDYGRPNHPQSWEAGVSTPWYAELYRKGEGSLMVGCDQCHQNMSSCDDCHFSHGFSAAQARRPEVCSGCHMGPDHPDWESYEHSKWGIIYQTTGEKWNWEKKLSQVVPGVDYPAPTCQYCHMYVGNNQWEMHVESKGIWRMGVIPPKEVEYKSGIKDFPYGITLPSMDRKLEIYSAENREKRRVWVELCSKCHSNRFATMWLDSLDQYMFASWKRIDEAQLILEQLFVDGVIQPPPDERPPFPLSDVIPEVLGPENLGTKMYTLLKETGGHLPVIGPVLGVYGIFTQTDGNPSGIETAFVEMWFWEHLQGYKGTAHAQQDLSWWWGAAKTGGSLTRIREEASRLRRLKALEDAITK
ncbi:MAG: hypothetical protein D8M57_10025 [Candidatus Scalindua sp. AMX11]|nr:MAG: hypothetical protein DWQ00_08775 [Candidatus Scalindua sp.]TDE65082.1 MAG: hypothetical protein D8M57_10025 [Candidatus Scalindua sp. AMX11]